jgi:hypothetical protein
MTCTDGQIVTTDFGHAVTTDLWHITANDFWQVNCSVLITGAARLTAAAAWTRP